jgi:hypothetical protein
VHPGPVLDALADVAEHALDVLHDGVGVVPVGQPVDLDVHPRLALGLALGLERAVRHRRHRPELAGDVADDVEAGVDHDVDVAEPAGQLHGQRVDEERHVVDHDLHDGVAAGGPAALAQRRRVHPDLGGPLGPAAGELVVGREGAVDVGRGAVRQVLVGHVPVVGAEQGLDALRRRPARPLAPPSQVGGLRHQLGLVRIVRRR